MKSAQTVPEPRLFFFDNLRYFLVMLVVLFHSIGSYNNFSDWWTVNDNNFLFFDSLLLFLDVFMMPGLFFIAGHFALQSHQGQNAGKFLKKKFIHLGIPWLIGVILVNPVQLYIWNLSQGQDDINLWQCFLLKLNSALSFYTGLVNLAEQPTQFIHLHYWFINLLFFFFIIFALSKKIKDAVLPKPSVLINSESPSNGSILLIIFFAGLSVFVLNIFLYGLFPIVTIPNTWVVAGNLAQFQASRVVLYSISFSLGIYAFHKNWFKNNKVPGHILIWIMLSAVLWFFLHETTFTLLKESSKNKAILYTLLHPMFFFSMLLTMLSIGIKFWNSSSKNNRLFAENSYNIYLIHLVVVFVFQMALVNLTVVPIYLKAIIVCSFSIGISLLISHYVINKSPRLSVAGMTLVFILMLAILR